MTVKFKDRVTEETIDSINRCYAVEIIGRSEARPNVYYLKATRNTTLGLLELANEYYSMSETVYSHPVFSVPAIKDNYVLYDYYNDYQWHLKKVTGDFNVATVWVDREEVYG